MPPELLTAITNAEVLIRDTARWIGVVGSRLRELKNPDVSPVDPDGPKVNKTQLLELVDVPCEATRETWSWAPKVKLAECKNAVQDAPPKNFDLALSLIQATAGDGSTRRGSKQDISQSTQ